MKRKAQKAPGNLEIRENVLKRARLNCEDNLNMPIEQHTSPVEQCRQALFFSSQLDERRTIAQVSRLDYTSNQR